MAKILGIGEILIRFDELENNNLIKYYGGSEYNVITNLVRLNNQGYFYTKLPQNYQSFEIIKEIRSYQIEINDDIFTSSEARIGTYYHRPGFGGRNGKVLYDRKYSAFSLISEITIPSNFYDVDAIFISGITLAILKEKIDDICLILKKYINKGGRIFFDCNYRKLLWTHDEARKAFKKIFPFVTDIFIGEKDFKYILLEQNTLQKNYQKLIENYPNIKQCFCTRRTIINNELHKYSIYYYDGANMYQSKEKSITVLDRIGSGDAFASIIIDQTLKNKKIDFEKIAYVFEQKHTFLGDKNQISYLDIEQWTEESKDIIR